MKQNFTVSSFEASDKEAFLSLVSVNDAVRRLNSVTSSTPNGSTPKMLVVIDQDPSDKFAMHMVEYKDMDAEGIFVIDHFKNENYYVKFDQMQGCYIVSKK